MDYCAYNHHFLLSFLMMIILISTSSNLRLFNAEGRKLIPKTTGIDPEKNINGDYKTIWRAQIGSRPPRCERRCSSCAQCEAIQVPTNKQVKMIRNENSTSVAAAAAAGDGEHEHSNYKPMSWKCKCGSLIFNP